MKLYVRCHRLFC